MSAERRRTVLVTGANSGIGQAAVVALLGHDVDVVATVRSAAGERSVRAAVGAEHVGRLRMARLDITDAAQCEAVVAEHRPDVLVNNAGDAQLGGVMDIDDDAALAQIESLVVAPTRLIRLVAGACRDDARPGRIVNVSSVLAEIDLPFTGWYSASKAAFDALGDALRLELRPSGVDVVRVECGAVKTGAWDGAGDEVAGDGDRTTSAARGRWSDVTSLARPFFASPSTVGEVIADAATDRRPRAVYRVGFGSMLGPLARFVPTRVEDAVTSTLLGLRRVAPARG